MGRMVYCSGTIFISDPNPDAQAGRSNINRLNMKSLAKRFNLSLLFFLLMPWPILAQDGDTLPFDQAIWETWWFYVLLICLIFAIFGLIYQAKAKQLQIERAMTARLRESEEALRQSEQQLNEAQRLAKVGSYTWEPDNPTVWSQYMFTLFGVPIGETLSFERFLSAVKPEDKERIDAAWHSFLTSARTHWELEYRIVGENGEERAVLAVGKVERDAEGRAVRVVGTVQDITERKQAEDAVRVSEHRYRTLFERTSNAIFVVDKRTSRFVDANDAAVQLSGHPLSALHQLTIRDISPEGAEAHHAAVSTNQSTDLGRMTYVRPDGTQRMALVNTVPLDDETAFSIARDITSEVRLEEQFREAQKLEAIGRLAGGIAHDFNNLLVPIIGYAELGMLELSPHDKLYANLDQINKVAERAANLVKQILAFGRRQILDLQTMDLNEVVADFQKMARRLLREDIELCVYFTPSLASIQADKAQIDQVLMNLMINAGDAMPAGGKLTIETANIFLDEAYFARYADEPKPGHYVMLAVSDTGHGMDADTLKHIFEPFFTTKERSKGTGLGLATIFGIVKQHRGHIRVYSEPGQGTTFKIYLPRTKEATQPVELVQTEPPSVHGTETVLVVEDEKMVRNLVCETLAAFGYNVIEATSPAHALELAAGPNETIHLLLTDVIMPQMNGRQLHHKIAAIRPEIKTLYMSGYTDNAIAHHGILDEAVNFLQKPFTVTGLAQTVRTVLNR